MPNNPKPPPTMDAFVRKSKPRVVTGVRPTHTVTAAPRAAVRSATSAIAQASSSSSRDEVMPSLPRSARSRSDDRSARSHVPDGLDIHVSYSAGPKPRKRFRKKVNGLFGDQTELKKRMDKLLVAASAEELFSSNHTKGIRAAKRQTSQLSKETSILPPADDVVKQLQVSNLSGAGKVTGAAEGKREHSDIDADGDVEMSPSDKDEDNDSFSLDSFDSPAFIATASRALGSPEKLRAVRKTMGRLSPRSNEKFLEEMQLGSSTSKLKQRNSQKNNRDGVEITPPELPSADSSEFETDERKAVREAILAFSPVSVDRTGAPAMLRRKVRRIDRGYRSADVLRARLHGLPLSDFAASPTVHRKPEKGTKWPKGKVRALDLTQGSEGARMREGVVRKRTLSRRLRRRESRSLNEKDESDSESSEGGPLKKSRRDAGPSRRRRDENSTGPAANAFEMLVSAAVQQKQTSTNRSGEVVPQRMEMEQKRRRRRTWTEREEEEEEDEDDEEDEEDEEDDDEELRD